MMEGRLTPTWPKGQKMTGKSACDAVCFQLVNCDVVHFTAWRNGVVIIL